MRESGSQLLIIDKNTTTSSRFVFFLFFSYFPHIPWCFFISLLFCRFIFFYVTTNIFLLSSIMTPSHWWCVLCLQQNTVCSLSCVCAVKSLHTTTILTVSGGVEAPGTCPSSQSSELHFTLLTPDPNHAAQPNHLPQRLGLQLAPLHAGWRRNPTHLHLNNKKNGKNVP